jgi:hypothetical protein
MLDAFPNAKSSASDGYLGALANLLTQYPRTTALHCADPVNGLARECKFLPSIAEAVKWLEREQLPLRNAADRERRNAEQFAQRDRDAADEKAEPLEHRRRVAERITRELKEAFARGDGMIPNVFVPSFAPQYADMCKRAEQEPPERAQYGHSLEDKNRTGIWVPLEWLKPSRARQQETPEQAKARVMSEYNISREQWDSIPDQPDSNDYWQDVRWPT